MYSLTMKRFDNAIWSNADNTITERINPVQCCKNTKSNNQASYLTSYNYIKVFYNKFLCSFFLIRII